jgi:hypothetical protein
MSVQTVTDTFGEALLAEVLKSTPLDVDILSPRPDALARFQFFGT